MIAVILAPLYIILNIFVLTRFFKWISLIFEWAKSKVFRISVSILYAFFMISPLLGFLIEKAPYHRILRIIGNYWMGIFLITLLSVLGFTVIGLILRLLILKDREKNKKIYKVAGLVCLVLIVSLNTYGFINSGIIRVTHQNITVNKKIEPSEGKEPIKQLKVALIADTHLGYSIGEKQMKQMVDKINEQDVDLVVLAGDIFDNNYSAIDKPEKIEKVLAQLKTKYGVYACWGNHDIPEVLLSGFTLRLSDKPYEKDPRFDEFLKNSKITMLEDESVKIDDQFYIFGRKDYSMVEKLKEKRKEVAELTEGMDKNLPIIMIDHQPKELGKARDGGVDVALSGHTHGGQIFPGNLTVKIPWENPYGILMKGDMTSCVTSGVGVWGPNMRLGSNPEIMILNMKFRTN